MNKLFVNNIGDLTEAQRASFYRFLAIGISEELEHFLNPFVVKIRILPRKRKVKHLVSLYPNDIKLKGPFLNMNLCLQRSLTYSIQLYIKSEYATLESITPNFLKNNSNLNDEISLQFNGKLNVAKNLTKTKASFKRTDKIQKQKDIFLGEIPLMTEDGTFILNGCERVVISQVIRSPGVYFRKEFTMSRKTIYTATIISNKGLWSKIIIDRRKISGSQVYEKEDRIYLYSNGMKGEKKAKKDDSDEDKIFLLDILRFYGLSFEEISDNLKYPLHLPELTLTKYDENSEIALQIAQFLLNSRSSSFSIGEIGRYKVNKKLGVNLPPTITYLTPYDLIKIIDGLIELKYYDRVSDDIDDIRNKQIRCVGDLLQNQLRAGLIRLKKSVKEQANISRSQKLNFDFEMYSDPDDWILDPRPVTNTIKDFFKTSQLSQFMDQINPLSELTHKRRISVFGPNGLQRDHISSVIRDIHPSQYGRLCPIETPEGQNAGLITSLAMFGRINKLGAIETPYFLMKAGEVFSDKRPIYLNPEQESETLVAFGDVSLDQSKKVSTEYLSVKENYLFSVKKTEEINFITTSPLQIISLATSLIPFIEHDDANRALMGSNMQRQAVPLLYPQKTIVGTGFEASAPLDSNLVIKNYFEGKVIRASSISIQISDFHGQKITYYLKKYYRSNQETCINQKPIVWIGEKVFNGQIIADGPGTNDGELALGRNLTIAYMPWEGYNYEDAIVISERIIFDDCLTSIHIEEYETTMTYSAYGMEKLSNEIPYATKYIGRHLNKNGIVKIGSYIKEHDLLVGKLTPCEPDTSPEAKLLRALFQTKEKEEKEKPVYRDTSLRVHRGTEGRVIDVRITTTPIVTPLLNTSLNVALNTSEKEEEQATFSTEYIRIFVAQIRKLKIGDKLAGRHGNKGIVSRILPRQDMPYLPDGTPIDIIFNPLGVPSRMNVGQVFECLLGLAGEKLGNRFKIAPFDEMYGKEASRVLVNQKLKEAALKTNCPWLFNESSPGKVILRDGRTGEYFDNPIMIGKTYILKLIHLVEDKIHARATGPYSMITEQPLAGKSQKGGQRFGEMEVWALEAYGCSNTLQELLTIKSDDIDGRNDMYEAILVRREIAKPNPSIPEAFLALIRELNALGLDFSLKKFEGGFYSTTNIKELEKDIFQELEERLKLRAFLTRKKVEYYNEPVTLNELTSQKKKQKPKKV